LAFGGCLQSRLLPMPAIKEYLAIAADNAVGLNPLCCFYVACIMLITLTVWLACSASSNKGFPLRVLMLLQAFRA
jgi:hypothetical protein